MEALIGYSIALIALEAGTRFGLSRQRALNGLAVLVLIATVLPYSSLPLSISVSLIVLSAASAQFTNTTANRLLPTITIAFGLIHGAGFAGGLKQANIVSNEVLIPLLGFNLGVELAQLLVLALCYAANHLITWSRHPGATMLPQAVNLGVFACGCFWFVERIL